MGPAPGGAGGFADFPIDILWSPFRKFARLEAASGLLSLACLAMALAWANSPYHVSYHRILAARFSLGWPGASVPFSLHQLIDHGLMAGFFLLVGLEIKREILAGELAQWRQAALPVAGALGGMLAPALLYLACNRGGPGARGWGVPVATDIAFAIGVLSLAGKAAPQGARIFLTALAIIDDIGGILVIVLFYSGALHGPALAAAAACLAFLLLLNRLGARHPLPYALGGLALWACLLDSGIHPTLAGILLAACYPRSARIREGDFARHCQALLDRFRRAPGLEATTILNPGREETVRELERACASLEPPLQRLERKLHPWVSFCVLPLYVLANAGIRLDPSMLSHFLNPITLGVVAGLVAGKPLGIYAASRLARRAGWAAAPAGTGEGHLFGASILGGIGFTMSLFIAGLAFPAERDLGYAKLGILAGSLLSGAMGWIWLRWRGRRGRARGAG